MDLLPIKNMVEAADFIRQSPRDKNIFIYGDDDVDGVTSVIIIQESLERLGFSRVKSFFCQKKKEGHGFTLQALDFLNSSDGIIILVDLGISDRDTVKKAQADGFQVIIIDHHEPPLGSLPVAKFIINPKQLSDDYPFKHFAAAGLCYYFSAWLLKEDVDFEFFDQGFTELAGIATLADMMPLDQENAKLVNRMFYFLETTTRPALRFCLDHYLQEDVTLREAVNRINGMLNASQVNIQRKAESFLLLTENNPSKILKIVNLLEKRLQESMFLKKEITEEAKQRLSEENISELIFIGDKDWPRRLVASVAVRLVDLYKRPAFVYSQGKDSSHGSARAPEGVDCVALMHECSQHLVNYGGHPPAAGFEVKNEDLQKLRICLLKSYQKLYG